MESDNRKVTCEYSKERYTDPDGKVWWRFHWGDEGLPQ